MTRTEFINSYATRSGIPSDAVRFAGLGLLDLGDGYVRIALPCACDEHANEPNGQGWAMVSAEGVLDHMRFHAPEPLRFAYLEAVARSGRE